MFSRMIAKTTAHVADLEDVLGVATLFLVLFLGLTFSGVA